MTCRETWFGEQAASYCTISSHIIGSSSSSNFPVGLPPLKKTSIKKKCQKGTPPGGGWGVPFWMLLTFWASQRENYNQVQNRTVPREDQVCLPLMDIWGALPTADSGFNGGDEALHWTMKFTGFTYKNSQIQLK